MRGGESTRQACLAASERELQEREQARRTDQAMRRHGQVISLVCGNLLAGRDGFAGIGQFVEERE